MEHKFTNHLIHESSPYLLQHAHNPVDWYPWGKEALDKARNENKLLIISIGYAACHWCHVMEHESFEDEKVAAFMNDRFISIKIDREERPDIDQVYMNAIQILIGNGGWPLNCIALPDGRPVYGGTYFPASQWLDMLEKVSDWASGNPEIAEDQAYKLTKSLQSDNSLIVNTETPEFTIEDLQFVFSGWVKNIDFIYGGHNHAPKFPIPVGWQYLLHYHHITRHQDALKAVLITLNKMADGGIYDQIGGGFARYSTDAYWKVPHFEKMLYDNAQLVSLYTKAYQVTKDDYYKVIVTETLDFIKRELTSEEGGFYASVDADSEGEEGRFYVWTKSEFQKALGIKAEMFLDFYNITDKGNWEDGKNILYKTNSDIAISDKYGITPGEFSQHLLETKKILRYERSQRIRPALDDKIINAWNALMLKGYVDAYTVFDNTVYLEMALKNATFINTKIKTPDYRLHRSYKNGKATINGFLDDYAFTIAAFISLYQATFDEKWLKEAQQLAIYTITHFYDSKTMLFFYTSDMDPPLIKRNIDVSDNVIPSANSEMAKNLYLLGHYFYNDEYIQMSKNMLNNVKQSALEYGSYYANWDVLMAWFVSETYEVTIVGDEVEAMRKQFNQYYLPNVLFAGAIRQGEIPWFENKYIEGQTHIYICRDKACFQPVADVAQAMKLLTLKDKTIK